MKYCLIVSLFFLVSGCAHQKTSSELAAHPEEAPPKTVAEKPPDSSIQAKEVAADEVTSQVTELVFAKGHSQLNREAQAKIDKLLSNSRSRGKLQNIIVVSWSDQEYPSESQKKLSDDEVALADRRCRSIQMYLNRHEKQAKIELINMAKRPSTLSKIFGFTDAQIKKDFQAAGIATTDSPDAAASKGRRSIVMIVLNQ